MRIPNFPESNHPLIKSLFHYSDRDLLTLFQRYPEQGKYFTTIVCRYSPIVYTLISHSARSPVQADYLFGLTWRHIFYETRGLVLPPEDEGETSSFQNWLINMSALCINQFELPPVEAINYNLQDAPPALWCYLEQALDLIPPDIRLMLIMSENFHWSETRIAAYLQAEGQLCTPLEVKQQLQKGQIMLEEALPEDIRIIYLDKNLEDKNNKPEVVLV